ncbi:MAG: PaaI family thioesterase [Steroidobacteraceae bacterium]|jgi:acyl-coenzyme A thioesterase PaaI-like protein|nr:PaaI family thioesterase [Steroidobacteraceae bacterium]
MSGRPEGVAASSTAQAIARRAALALARIPYARQLGACLDERAHDPGVVLLLPFQQRLIGNTQLPSIHGGVIGSFMQITAVVAAFAQLGEQRPPRLIDFSIDYLSRAEPKDLRARCNLTRVGRRVAAVSVGCWQTDESAPTAVARAHLFVGEAARK